MVIRVKCFGMMEDSDSPPSPGHDDRGPEWPPSPCDSEISVGYEADDQPSPMDMTAQHGVSTEDYDTEPHSPSTSIGIPSPGTLSSGSLQTESYTYLSEDEYFRPLKKLAMSGGASPPTAPLSPVSNPASPTQPQQPELIRQQQIQHRAQQIRQQQEQQLQQEEAVRLEQQKQAGLRSFSILDILSYKPSRRKSSAPVKIIRPWDTIDDEDSEPPPPKSAYQGDKKPNDKGSALDALFKMTNTTLDNLSKDDKADAVNLFNNRQAPKKKRKSRTAFTNTQIFELEKRFLYQKYLSPADRDELAQTLGLSNAQVITWWQNRRAKLKRDIEELKRDVEVTKVGVISNKALLEASVNMAVLLKANKDSFRIPMPSFRHH